MSESVPGQGLGRVVSRKINKWGDLLHSGSNFGSGPDIGSEEKSGFFSLPRRTKDQQIFRNLLGLQQKMVAAEVSSLVN